MARPLSSPGLVLLRWAPLALPLAVLGTMLLINPRLRDPGLWETIGRNWAGTALLALALTPVVITGGIDLSVGSVLGLSAVAAGFLWRDAGLSLGVALAEMCMASGKGAKVAVGGGALHGPLFGEDQARYVVAVSAGDAAVLEAEAVGIPLRELGTVGGSRLEINGALSIEVEQLTIAHESWFPNFMAGTVDASAA